MRITRSSFTVIFVVKSTTFITMITQGNVVTLLHYENGLALHDSVTV